MMLMRDRWKDEEHRGSMMYGAIFGVAAWVLISSIFSGILKLATDDCTTTSTTYVDEDGREITEEKTRCQ